MLLYFSYGATVPSRPGPPPCPAVTITLRHITLGRTPLDERSDRCRDLYLSTHNTHKRREFLHLAGFEPANPESEWPKTHTP